MYCPECGAPDQSADSYCRSCGTLLPDLEALAKKEIPVSAHLTASGILSLMTIVASFLLAATLYVLFFNRDDTHFVIYLTAGFLIAIGCWNIQTFWRTRLLQKRLKGYGEAGNSFVDKVETRKLENPAAESAVSDWNKTERRTTQRLRINR
jgi:hypothetical protein